MRPGLIFVGIIVACVVLTGWLFLAGEMSVSYGMNMSDRYFATLTELQGTTNVSVQTAVSMQENLQGGDVSSTNDMEGGLISNALSVLFAVPTYFNVFKRGLNLMGEAIGVPPFFIVGAFAVLVVSFLFWLASYIRGSEKA